MKKVLIITYYWPPSGGAGVQRWLRFVKHLRTFGWEPIIYTPENPVYPIYDEKLLHEIPENITTYKLPIKEPNAFIAKLAKIRRKNPTKTLYETQQQKRGKRSLKDKILWAIRGNFFIPDARYLWIKPSVNYLPDIIKKEKIEAIVTTGPPHSMHLIGLGLKKQLGLPWLADFRDPWTSMDYLKQMYLSPWAWKKHYRLERAVLTSADCVTVVGKTMYNEFKQRYNILPEILYNGYDETVKPPQNTSPDKNFSIVHIGSFQKIRNTPDLWQVLAKKVASDKEFASKLEIKLIGKIDNEIIESIKQNQLEQYLTKIDYIPYHETQQHLFSAQVLLLPIDRTEIARFVLTGKLFEYLKSKRPILLIGPENGDAADIIKKCQAGLIANFNDLTTIEQHINTLFNAYKNNTSVVNPTNIEQFSGKELTHSLSKLLNNISKKGQSY